MVKKIVTFSSGERLKHGDRNRWMQLLPEYFDDDNDDDENNNIIIIITGWSCFQFIGPHNSVVACQ